MLCVGLVVEGLGCDVLRGAALAFGVDRGGSFDVTRWR